MKLSLAWAFSHIKKIGANFDKDPFVSFSADYESGEFFDRIGATIAEIEHVEKVFYSLESIFFGVVIGPYRVYIDELHKEVTLSADSPIPLQSGCLVIKKNDIFTYLSLADLYAHKEGFLPPVFIPEDQRRGAWKQGLYEWDYILTFDNKALTHRPDLWGHRGFAREIAALFHLDLIPDDHMITHKPIRSFLHEAPPTAGNIIGLRNDEPLLCNRVALMTISSVQGLGSFPGMALRLCAIDAKPINALVDCTNYVMYDTGQPMHAFDADRVQGTLTVGRIKSSSEKRLTLLDGTFVDLTDQDLVIRDDDKVLALAGIIGGKSSAVSATTSSVLIEASSYDAATIRKASLRHKIRSESSTRFEKSLDPLQNTYALMRFLYLLDMHIRTYTTAQAIILVGTLPAEKVIVCSNEFIQARIGVTVPTDDIHRILQALGFGVQQKTDSQGTIFSITVPPFRATKDISLPEDIVEEIARFIGFNNLPMQLPTRTMKPFSIAPLMARRALKRLCAYGLFMREVSNYAVYDNHFLHQINLEPDSAYTLANPVSENWTSLVSSLIPHLLKNIEQNMHNHNHMAFFEMNGVWKKGRESVIQQDLWAGVWYATHQLDFYTYKDKINQLFNLLGCTVLWRKPVHRLPVWYHPYQTAELIYNGNFIGHAGLLSPEYMRKLSSGSAFIAEYDYNVIIDTAQETRKFKPLSPFQPLVTDMSLFVPFNVSIDAIEHAIAQRDARIYHIELIDYFEKPEWKDKRSATLRYKAVDDEKSFSKDEIEQVRAAVAAAVNMLGVTIR